MSPEAASERRHGRRERIGLSLNVLLLRAGTRALGCRLLDISQGGAAIALPSSPKELIEKGYTPEIKTGDEIDILCSIETDPGRKNFQFPARVAHIRGAVIGVSFTEGHSPVDEFLESYFSSRIEQKQGEASSGSIAAEILADDRSREGQSLLRGPVSPANAPPGGYATRKPPSTGNRSISFDRFNVLSVGIVLLTGLGAYFFYLQQQLSDLRASVLSVSEQVSGYGESLRQIDIYKASIRQIHDRLGLMSASVAEAQDQLEKLSAATAAPSAGQGKEADGPVPAVAVTAHTEEPSADEAVINVADSPPVQLATPPAERAEPLEPEVASPVVTTAGGAPQERTAKPSPKPKLFILTADAVNVRENPGTEFPISFRLDQGDRVSVLSTQGIWLQVEAPNQRVGWVSSTYARPLE